MDQIEAFARVVDDIVGKHFPRAQVRPSKPAEPTLTALLHAHYMRYVFDDGDLTRDLRRAVQELEHLERTIVELKAEIQHREAALRAQGNSY